MLLQTAPCGVSMGISHGLDSPNLTPKLKNRWLFSIPNVSIDGVNTLPPRKSARPGASTKDFEIQHLVETISFPGRIEWKTINVVLYDTLCNQNPVFDWLLQFYTITRNSVTLGYPVDYKKSKAKLELYSGSGQVLQTWVYENIYPTNIDWQELDMDSNEIVCVDLTLKYDRAYDESSI